MLQLEALQFIEVSNDTFATEKSKALESWNRKNKKQRTNHSYLNPNPHLRHLKINAAKNKHNLCTDYEKWFKIC